MCTNNQGHIHIHGYTATLMYVCMYIAWFWTLTLVLCAYACACVCYVWGGKVPEHTVPCNFSSQMWHVYVRIYVCVQISCLRCWPMAKSCLVSAAAIAIKTKTIANMYACTLYYASSVNRANTYTPTHSCTCTFAFTYFAFCIKILNEASMNGNEAICCCFRSFLELLTHIHATFVVRNFCSARCITYK